jgi:hypothetical protein
MLDALSNIDPMRHGKEVKQGREWCPNFRWWERHHATMGTVNGRAWGRNLYGKCERYYEDRWLED